MRFKFDDSWRPSSQSREFWEFCTYPVLRNGQAFNIVCPCFYTIQCCGNTNLCRKILNTINGYIFIFKKEGKVNNLSQNCNTYCFHYSSKCSSELCLNLPFSVSDVLSCGPSGEQNEVFIFFIHESKNIHTVCVLYLSKLR